jgi:(2Fe-2S) ferredoxin
MKYPFEKLFLVCVGKSCNDAALGKERGEEIQQELKAHNKEMGRKGTVRVCQVSCLDMCDFGPNIVVHPRGDLHSHMNRKSARRLYDEEMGD